MASHVTDANFEKEVKNHKGFALVDFWAEWCGPCRQLSPIIDEVSKEMEGKVKICKLNVDESPEIASAYGIRSIPTLILFQNGRQISTKIGSLPKSTLSEWLKSETAA